MKLESYPFQRFGTVNGVLERSVRIPSARSRTMTAKRAKQLVYHVQVRITENAAALVARGIHLRPGLVASAEIKTGSRSIASYILNPVLKITDESLREP